MRTATASYWIPIQVREPPEPHGRYTGFQGKKYKPLDEFMSQVIEDMTHIYGNIAGMYYIVEKITDGEFDSCHFHLQVTITGVVAGDADADDYIDEKWPMDLEEWFTERWDEQTSNDLLGYDLNPMLQGPTTTFHNGTW